MSVLILCDVKKNRLGQVDLSGGQFSVAFDEPFRHLTEEIEKLLAEVARRGGAPSARLREEGGRIIKERKEVAFFDEGFPKALADVINNAKIQPPRVFAVVQRATKGADENA